MTAEYEEKVAAKKAEMAERVDDDDDDEGTCIYSMFKYINVVQSM